MLVMVAAVVGVVGVGVGAWLTSRHEERRWRLDIKFKLYLRLAQVAEDFRTCAVEQAGPDYLYEHDAAWSARWEDARMRFFAAMPEAAVVASNDVYDALRKLSSDGACTIQAGLDGEGDPKPFIDGFDRLATAANAVLEAMRSDLGFGKPQLHIGTRPANGLGRIRSVRGWRMRR